MEAELGLISSEANWYQGRAIPGNNIVHVEFHTTSSLMLPRVLGDYSCKQPAGQRMGFALGMPVMRVDRNEKLGADQEWWGRRAQADPQACSLDVAIRTRSTCGCV